MTLLSRFLLLPLLSAALYFVVRVVTNRNRRRGAATPPGPRGWPFIGSALELASSDTSSMTSVFQKWGQKYGPITEVNIMRTKNVILSDPKIAVELFVRRGNRYSNRGASHAVEYISMNQNPGFRPKDDGWRRQRSMIQSAVNITSIDQYQILMDDEATQSVFAIVQSSSSFHDELLRYAYSVLTSSLFGFSIPSASDPYIKYNEEFTAKIMTAFRPDCFPSNVFPILKYMPHWLVPSMRTMEDMRREYVDQMWAFRSRVEESVKDGTAQDSIYKRFLLNRSEFAVTDEESVHTFQGMIDGGTRSPHNNLLTFLILMMEYPEWQARLQREVDQVIGSNRMPNCSDIPSLPTVRAIVKEGVRYRSIVAEMGITHCLEQDDIFDGFFFEKGTIFHATFASILTDIETYPDGQLFNPARWLEPVYPTYKEPLTLYPDCHKFPAFGYGRRACPGVEFAERSLNIMVAKLAWAVNIRRPLDQNGNELRETIAYEGVPAPRPLKFGCRIEPRDPTRIALLRKVAESLHDDNAKI
ncbi:putative cytochrome P450 oxidoreductase [Phaeosphaeriaceae sp. PMI808]|nr:putative cytochrome P450 oxidoreductase [Phaeosphaeriaceae sp. PMI808]